MKLQKDEWKAFICEKLDCIENDYDRSKVVLKYLHLLEKGTTFDLYEIGELLNTSFQNVSVIEKNALRKILFYDSSLKDYL